jgi:hypothetical protein
MPLLETPGSKAIACIKPIAKTLLLLRSSFPDLTNLVEKTTIPVKKKKIPIRRKEDSVDSIIPLRKKPTKAAGIIPITINNTSFQLSLLNLSISAISFLVNIITAKREARCRKVMKNKFGSPIKLDTSARCPSEDTGKNSVKA